MMLLILFVAAIGATGCSAGPQQLDEAYSGKSAEELGKKRRELFDKVAGDYDKLSPEDKKWFVDGFGGKEESAKIAWGYMLHPPSSQGAPQRPPTATTGG